MNNINYTAAVNPDGSIVLPSFLVRGLGLDYGDTISISCPAQTPECDRCCDGTGLFLSRCCIDADCSGYSSDGDELNIPTHMLAEAGIKNGTDIAVLVGDKVLVLVAAEDDDEDDLALEIECLLKELGIETEGIKVIRFGGYF